MIIITTACGRIRVQYIFIYTQINFSKGGHKAYDLIKLIRNDCDKST